MFILINQYLKSKALNLSRTNKKLLALTLDIILCFFATWLSLSLRLEKFIIFTFDYNLAFLVSVSIAIPIFILMDLYKGIFRYNSNMAIWIIAKAMFVYGFIYSLVFTLTGIEGIPRSIGLMQPTFLFWLIGSSRWLVKTWLGPTFSIKKSNDSRKNILIYGSGRAGRQLASSLLHSNEFKLINFIDDNKAYWEGTIDGYSVISPPSIKKVIETKDIKQLWLAIPNLYGKKRLELINNLRKFPVHVRTLPSLTDLINGKVRFSDLRELDVNELLGRDAVKPDTSLLKKCILKKTVLITGAGGSIGSEICRQIINHQPKVVLLIDNSELALYNIHNELQLLVKKQSYEKLNHSVILVPLLINIQDEKRLSDVFRTWQPETVYHTAAFKHVPMVEFNVISGIKNNVFGTLNCAKISLKNKVENFVLISTDKAVRPTSIMGASKRLAEMLIYTLNNDKENLSTCFSMVRFGNVLGSSGSVIPLFRKQIEAGGPITLTDKRVTRYFMTSTEAAQLVIQAGGMAKGGEVFLLDMGNPVLIFDLARNIIKATGLSVKDDNSPWGDIEIKITGLRVGEKLYEELLISGDAKKTQNNRILKTNENFLSKNKLNIVLKSLENLINKNDVIKIRKLLIEHVTGYKPNEDIVDLIATEIEKLK